MACGRPLFPGSTAEEQLGLIFRALGSPPTGPLTEIYEKTYRSPPTEPLLSRAPRLDKDAKHLLSKFLLVRK